MYHFPYKKSFLSLHSPIDLPHYAKAFDITNRRITPKDAEVVDEVEFFVTARFFTSSAENTCGQLVEEID